MEHLKQTATEQIKTQYDDLIAYEPRPVTNYVPSNGSEQKQAFLNDEIRNPDHMYPKLEAIDFDAAIGEIKAIGQRILDNAALNPKYAVVYEQFIVDYQKKTRLMQLAHSFKHAEDSLEKYQIRQEYMRLNVELYGEPDETTYKSLLKEQLDVINQKDFSGQAANLRQELLDMTGYETLAAEKVDRFKPSEETVDWMHEMTETLYGGMLSHIPEGKETFSEKEIQEVFQLIIREEFGEAADDWTVDVEPATAINVKAGEKRIVIPDDREVSRQVLRGLVVHEIGVHMLRSVMGGETDLEPLRNGLNNYYDAEEGLGKVMEQAIGGNFIEAGTGHYITAGLAYHNHKDFRDTFESKWRIALLTSLKDDEEITEEAITKAKKTAYGSVMRIMRGTDELPWFKDLSYYNGSVGMWRHLESIRRDDIKFMFVLMGKADPSNSAHERTMYETASI